MSSPHVKPLSGHREKAAWVSPCLSWALLHDSSDWFSSCSRLSESVSSFGVLAIPSGFLEVENYLESEFLCWVGLPALRPSWCPQLS